jgi:K+-sensing histidine kinase KdpD
MNEIEILKQELKDTKLMLSTVMEMNQFKSSFLARSAHELRSPLSSLIALHQLILEGLCDSPQEEREFIAKGKDYGLKLLDLLNQLIDISKIEVGALPLNLQLISLNELLNKVHDLVKVYAKNKGLRLQFNLLDQDENIIGDKKIIQQVLVMIINSIISLVEEGEIKILSHGEKSDHQTLLIIEFPFISEYFLEKIDLSDNFSDSDYLLNKHNISQLDNLQFSPKMCLGIAQNLLRKMGGYIKINNPPKINSKPENDITQLYCWLPLLIDD